jgi:ADP-heptose:LPS heptosyltransferase
MDNRDQQVEQRILNTLQQNALVERLVKANRRIVELERAERRLVFERDKLAAMISSELEGVQRQREDHELWPAARVEWLVNSLTIVQRRDAWLAALSKAGISGSPASLYPHNGEPNDPLAILIRGSGGFGDMLYLSAVARLLFLRFDRPRIVVLHEHPDAARVFSTNPYIVATISLPGDDLRQFLQCAASLDVFDLIADVRYVITYATPPLSRIPFEFLTVAHSRAAQWQRFVRREWPYLNNLLAKEALARGMSKFGLVGYTGNLSISENDVGDFFPKEGLPNDITAALTRPYVTLHHGADRFMSDHGGLATKNLPTATWRDVSYRCKVEGLTTVQLGEAREPHIEGVDLDLRGRTSFAQTAVVLKYASVHLDTEGGLVHLAKSMGTSSVVAFGPTPVRFFGYDGNLNLSPHECGDCWWISEDWATRCPRGMAKPACMASHTPSTIASSALVIARQRKSALIRRVNVDIPSVYESLNEKATEASDQRCQNGGSGIVVVDNMEELDRHIPALARHGLRFRLAVTDTVFSKVAERTSFVDVVPFVSGHIPCGTDALDWAVVALADFGDAEWAATIADVIRTLKKGSSAYILGIQGINDERSYDLRTQLLSLPGAKIDVAVGSSGGASDSRSTSLQLTVGNPTSEELSTATSLSVNEEGEESRTHV